MVAASSVFFILVVLAVLLFCIFQRRKPASDSKKNLVDLYVLQKGQRSYINPSAYDDPEDALKTFSKEISTSAIKVDKLIGGGEFGEVYQGSLLQGDEKECKMIAIKVLKANACKGEQDHFLIEACILGQFNDPNILAMEGVVTQGGRIMIITELMSNGSLDNFLKKQGDGLLSIIQLLGMARGIASGMKYLSEMRFIHRDLAARNILVNEDLVCKVADFGLARDLEDNQEKEEEEKVTHEWEGKIPVRWTAPEAFKFGKSSYASDVWSYGIVLWEILAFGQRPYWDWRNDAVKERVESGYRLPPPMGCPKVVHQLMLDCWHVDRERPKFTDLVQRLDEMIRSSDLLKNNSSTSTAFQPKPPAVTDVANATIRSWLEELKMAQYTENFTSAGFTTLSQVATMKESDLNNIGIHLIGHRRKIFKSICSMNTENRGFEQYDE